MQAEIKPGCGFDRVKLADAIPLDTPFTLNIAPATVCNFRCRYCVHSLPKERLNEMRFKPEIMDWEVFLQAAEETKAFPRPLKVISLTGNGEPLCNRRLPDMVAHLKSIGTSERVEFISNGALLNDETALALVDAGLDTIRISIQGVTSERYRDICGARLEFEEFVEKIRFFYEHKKKCNLFVKTVDLALDPGEEEKFYGIFGEISDRIYIEKIMPVFHGVDYTGMLKDARVMDRYGNAHDPRLVCPQCFFTITVWPNGDLYPCDVLADPASLGNIAKVSLKECWDGEMRKEFLRMQLLKKRMENPVCKNCCAPDDVSQETDELDPYAAELLKRCE